MIHRGPFQPLPFCDSVTLHPPSFPSSSIHTSILDPASRILPYILHQYRHPTSSILHLPASWTLHIPSSPSSSICTGIPDPPSHILHPPLCPPSVPAPSIPHPPSSPLSSICILLPPSCTLHPHLHPLPSIPHPAPGTCTPPLPATFSSFTRCHSSAPSTHTPRSHLHPESHVGTHHLHLHLHPDLHPAPCVPHSRMMGFGFFRHCQHVAMGLGWAEATLGG